MLAPKLCSKCNMLALQAYAQALEGSTCSMHAACSMQAQCSGLSVRRHGRRFRKDALVKQLPDHLS